MNWTPDAEKTLSDFFAQNRHQLCPEGTDSSEVESDIRNHVDEELRAGGTEIVTVGSVQKILRGFVDSADPEPVDIASGRPKFMADAEVAAKPLRTFGSVSFWFFAILLPLVTLCLEAVTGFCAGVFFDPIPTVFHGILVALVPITNFLHLKVVNQKKEEIPTKLLFMTGCSIVVGIYYTLLFLPLYPYACIGIIAYGIGLLPLASGTGLIGTFLVKRRFKKQFGKSFRRPFLIGLTCGIAALGILELPKYIGRAGLHMAASESPATKKFGIGMLRAIGSEDTLLRACYEPSRKFQRITDTSGWVFGVFRNVSTDDAREVYFRVTGSPFNFSPPPNIFKVKSREFTGPQLQFDDERGGTAVGARLAGLHAESSRMDMHIDPLSALAYTEWTLVFDNRQSYAQEARFETQLPPGGVVSRLTLWVNGEPQEAAFGTRSAVRAAYRKVAIVQQRDPVLVTTSGPDRVLVQCFPVPPNGTMKIRVGITAPVQKGDAWLPHFTERNFGIGDDFGHSVWAQSRKPLSSDLAPLSEEKTPEESAYALRGEISDIELSSKSARIRPAGIEPSQSVWTKDPFKNGAPLIREPGTESRPAHSHIFVVLDSSAGMKPHWPEIEQSLTTSSSITYLVANDTIEETRSMNPRGGKDNAVALLAAFEKAAAKPNSAIVWIHAPQPVLLTDAEAIAQRLERGFAKTPLYDFPVAPGPNRVLAAIDGFSKVRAAPRNTKAGDFINALLTSAEIPNWNYRHLTKEQTAPEGAVEVWDQLARYAGYETVMDSYYGALEKPDIATFAAIHQLVTPFSGAVVLETKEQFEDAGLDQLDPGATPSIPTIPEPGTTLLLMLAASGWLIRRKR